tara:strand:- start:316 stop:960 length:645 start_codon:yes stop_codon:yes gene_type:complete
MDGNGRWATEKGKSRTYGHKIGASKVYEIYKNCIDVGFKTVSFFAMSSENMSRSDSEIKNISSLLEYSINNHFQDLIKNKIKFNVIGDTKTLPMNIKETISNAESATAGFSKYQMNIAYNYGGKWDIINAVNKAISQNEDITSEVIEKYLSTKFDYPDLIVRTGGYKRLSNFMLWQSAYSELVFLDTLWPDLTKDHIQSIFNQHVNTKRKFGIV